MTVLRRRGTLRGVRWWEALGRRVAASRDARLAAAIGLTLAALAETRLATPQGVDVTTGVVLSFAATAPLVVARRPGLVAAVIGGVTAAWLALAAMPPLTVLIGQTWALYAVAAAFPRRAAALALIPLTGNAVYPYDGDDNRSYGIILLCAGLVAVALGDAHRRRRGALAERDAARHDQAVLAERSRIARELHDVVAHHVSMMVVMAETARVGTPGLVPQAGQSFESIRDTGRQALAEMRRLLGVLRPDVGPSQAPQRSPQPDLRQIGELVETVRAGGMTVVLRWEGQERVVPPGVGLSAYRIIQEALTNVRRHAPGAAVEILIGYTAGAIRLRVRDAGPGPKSTGAQGYGLIGMRERVAMAGGRLTAGPAEGGGFEIEAELPTGGAA